MKPHPLFQDKHGNLIHFNTFLWRLKHFHRNIWVDFLSLRLNLLDLLTGIDGVMDKLLFTCLIDRWDP